MAQRRLGDRYEVGELLGRGGMAEVHLGRDLRLGRSVAVKSLRVDLARDSSFQTRFRREAQSAASLNHPNVVAVYDTGEEHSDAHGGVAVPFIVMEHVQGTTLRELMSGGRRLLPERALEITSSVLDALEYSHGRGIVHRDIKPANVMLTDAGEIKVMDFGIARAMADTQSTMTQAGSTLGTAQYLSPEQAQGGDVDPRSDIYSTGCMLYELLTGRPPFVGDSPVSIAYQHVRENPLPPSQVDPDITAPIDAIVMKSLAKNPDNRYQTAAEMRDDIAALLGGRPVAATPVDDETRAITTVTETVDVVEDRTGERRKRLAIVLLGLLVAIAAIAGLVALLSSMSGGQQVVVEDVVGMTEEDAVAALRAQDLAPQVQRAANDQFDEGLVFEQDPGPAATVDEGSTVRLLVSLGPDTTTVPNLVGMSLADATTALEDRDLVRGDTTERASDEAPGTVLESDPPANEEVEPGTVVDLVVSSGEREVPDVVDTPYEIAEAQLVNLGFEVRPRQVVSDEVAAGNVVAQSIAAGDTAAPGTRIVLDVAQAPPPPPPDPEPTDEPTDEPTPTDTDTGGDDDGNGGGNGNGGGGQDGPQGLRYGIPPGLRDGGPGRGGR